MLFVPIYISIQSSVGMLDWVLRNISF